MASIVKRIVKLLNSNRALSNIFLRKIYNFKYYPYSYIIQIDDIENRKAERIIELEPSLTFTNYYPKFHNQKEKCDTTQTPEIHLYHFNNAVIHIASSSIIVKNQLVTYRTKDERYNEGFVKIHDNDYAKVDIKNREDIEEALFLGGNGSWNWFHFLIEIMPKLTIYDKKNSQVLLVNDIVLKTPSMQKILNIVSKNNFEIKYLSSEKAYYVKNLYHINDFNHLQFNRFDNLIKSDGTSFNAKLTRNYSEVIINEITPVENLPQNIFLYRKNTHRIANNQDEILNYLVPYGFVAVCLEELSLEMQVNYFKNAKFIIGISGAAWSNLIFCRNKPKSICFIPDNAKEFSAFSNLAYIFNVDLLFQTYETNNAHHYSSNFEIDFIEFKLLFKSLINEN